MKKLYGGFTLIEVLIALLILTIALFAIIKAVQDGIHDTIRVQDRMEAHWVAMNVLSRMQVGLLSLPTKENPITGWEHLLSQRWRWEAGVDQGGSDYYERTYVNVYRDQNRVAHLVGFVRLGELQRAT